MEKEGLFKITIPAGAIAHSIEDFDQIFENQEELLSAIDQNMHLLNKEQLEYFRSLLNLEISIFQESKQNEILSNLPVFFDIAKYNLFEGLLKKLKHIDYINKKETILRIGLPYKNWLELTAYTESGITAIPLLDIEMSRDLSEMTIYDSEEFNEEKRIYWTKYYQSQKKDVPFWLNERKQKCDIPRVVCQEILDYWNLTNFEPSLYDPDIKVKNFSWIHIDKKISH